MPHLWLLLLVPVVCSAQTVNSSVRSTCHSLECVTLAAGIATLVNRSADPCEDFYNFACGNFPNTVSYSPYKVRPGYSVKISLFEDVMSLMGEKVKRKIYELLALDRLAPDSDPDVRDLYRLTRQFFLSCTEWMRGSEIGDSEPYQEHLSVSFLKGIHDHLMHWVDLGVEGTTFEAILAGIVRAGGNSLVNVRLAPRFRFEAYQSNLTNVTRAEISSSERYIDRNERGQSIDSTWISKYADFIESKNISGLLSLDNVDMSFVKIAKEMHQSKLNMSKNLAEKPPKCPITAYRYTLEELDALSECAYPGNSFSWTLFFEHLLQSPADTDAVVELTDPPSILAIVNYFKNQSLLSNDGSRLSEHISYVVFDWLMSFGDFLPKNLRQSWEREMFPRYDPERLTLRPKSGRISGCITLTKSYMQPVLERMYRVAYHPTGFGSVKSLIHLIKKASISSVRRQSWIKESGRDAIVEKIKWVRHSTGLSELATPVLKAFYNMTIAAFKTINLNRMELQFKFGALMSVVQCAHARRNFALMSGSYPVEIFTQLIDPLNVNAYNYQGKNRIIFPMTILEPPAYHASYPIYINLGSLGTVIGHEIGHSFDETGHALNRQGAVGHFWDNATEAAYLDRLECVRSRYGNYSWYPGGPSLNSDATLGNDISDIMGLKASYDALQMVARTRPELMSELPNLQLGLSHEQLFFVRAAQSWCFKVEPDTLAYMAEWMYQSHSPNHLRVLGMMENSWEFAKTFQCKVGQRMHPRMEKCTFW